jgi:hypothetical protein
MNTIVGPEQVIYWPNFMMMMMMIEMKRISRKVFKNVATNFVTVIQGC